jgi:hypothetical protein
LLGKKGYGLAFCYNEITEIINLKRGKVYFSSQFRGFTPWSFGTIDFGPIVRQHSMV